MWPLTPETFWEFTLLYRPVVTCSVLQYYEKLTPTIAPQSSAAASADIAAALASEVAELKQQDGKLFAYHSTGVSGLAYITMRDDAGNSLFLPHPAQPIPALSCCLLHPQQKKWLRRCCARMLASINTILNSCLHGLTVWTPLAVGPCLQKAQDLWRL